MSSDTSNPFDAPSEELVALAAAACDGTITAEGSRRLEELLRGDTRAQRFYVAYVDLHSRLLWRFRDDRAADASPSTDGKQSGGIPVVPSSVRQSMRAARKADPRRRALYRSAVVDIHVPVRRRVGGLSRRRRGHGS
jgi:hypothetical protein